MALGGGTGGDEAVLAFHLLRTHLAAGFLGPGKEGCDEGVLRKTRGGT